MDDKIFKYEVVVRQVKYARLELKGQQLRAIVPHDQYDVESLIDKHQGWIQRAQSRMAQIHQTYQQLPKIDRSQSELEILIKNLISHGANILVVQPRTISYRRMRRRWGSCSSRGDLKFNTHLAYLSDAAVWYVVYHELCHLRYQSHGKRFHALIKKQFLNYKTFDRILAGYWLNQTPIHLR